MQIKKINFQGLSSVPSQYDSPDGPLDFSLNAISEDGAFHPVLPPKTLKRIDPYQCLSIHNAAGKEWIILFLDTADGGEVYASPNEPTLTPVLIASGFDSRPAVAVIGNTLTISDGTKTSYAIYSSETGNYKPLGDSIPEISIDIALARKHTNFLDSVTVGVPDGTTIQDLSSILTAFRRGGGARGTYGRTGHNTQADILLDNVENAVYALLNKQNTQAAEENTFIHPFLIRWALRLFDGTYIRQSAPILMIPNSGMPPLSYEASVNQPFVTFSIKTMLRRCALQFRPTGLDALAPWSDIVKSIDFFVTPPIYVYDQSGTIHAVHRTSSDPTVFSHAGAQSALSKAPALDTAVLEAEASGSQSKASETPDGGNHRHPTTPDDSPQYTFPAGNCESVTETSNPAFVPTVFSRQHIEAGITAASVFHLIASVPLFGEDAVSDTPAFMNLDLNDSALSTLTSRPLLPDDWRSHDQIHFSIAHPYNSRLSVAGVSSSLFHGFRIPDMAQFCNIPDSPDIPCTVWVKTVRDFKPFWTSVSSILSSGHLPRFLFYPDPAAVEMRIICTDGSGWILPLKTHDFLNGAFWFDGLGLERSPKSESVQAPAITSQDSDIIPESSKILVSHVGNPFVFPVESRISVGFSKILAISSAAKALSEGQFGQFPLYAFTSEGVWALEVSATGTISARQPITRDVCINPRAVTQIDSAVIFPSDRGIMLLSGSRAEVISDMVNDRAPFDISSLPGFNVLHAFAHGSQDACFPTVSFLSFIRNAGIVYDYTHQRLIIFNPEHSYAYIFSLKSHLWGMTYSTLDYSVPAYPEAFAVDQEGNLVDFSAESNTGMPAIIVTRPLKLDTPDHLKSVASVHIHGNCDSSRFRTILYASRNLSDWQVVASSVTGRITNRSGSPFRYFRLAFVAFLDRPDSVSDATFRFSPRLPNFKG